MIVADRKPLEEILDSIKDYTYAFPAAQKRSSFWRLR